MSHRASLCTIIAASWILGSACSSSRSGGSGGSTAKAGSSGSGGNLSGGASGNQSGGASGNQSGGADGSGGTTGRGGSGGDQNGGSGFGGNQSGGSTAGSGGNQSGGSGGGGNQSGGSTAGSGGNQSGGSTAGSGGNSGGSGGTNAKGGSGGNGGGSGGGGAGAGGNGSGTGGTAGACASTSTGTAANTLTVNVDSAQVVISKEIFGVLMERVARSIQGGLYVGTQSTIPNTNGLRNDMIQGFKDIAVGAIEWPGGGAANTYDWTTTNPSNDMGTDLFMQFISLVGATPILVGKYDATSASSNLKWLTYIHNNPSHPDWYVPFFKVGNEAWYAGDTEASYEAKFLPNSDALSPPINGKQVTLIASTGDTVVSSNGQAIEDLVWLDTALKNLGSKIGGVEIHEYIYHHVDMPNLGFTDDQYYGVMNDSNQNQMGPHLDDIIAVLDKRDPDKRIKMIEDEWGVWLEPLSSSDSWLEQGTLMHGLASAETLHLFMQRADRIGMAGLAQAVNVIHSLFLTRASDGVMVKTPTFYVWKMFVPHHSAGAKWAPSTLTSEKISGNNTTFPVLSAGTTVDSSGHVNISLVNVDLTKTRSIQITLNSSRAGYAVSSAQFLTGAAKDTYNDFGKPEQVNIQDLPAANYSICQKGLDVTLPPKSVVMLVLNPQ
jgi:alpha-N-arabinofuranosidase